MVWSENAHPIEDCAPRGRFARAKGCKEPRLQEVALQSARLQQAWVARASQPFHRVAGDRVTIFRSMAKALANTGVEKVMNFHTFC